LLRLKSIGVKFKVFVEDKDSGWFGDDEDNIDSFVQLLQPTPDLDNSTANWTRIIMLGKRRKHKTR